MRRLVRLVSLPLPDGSEALGGTAASAMVGFLSVLPSIFLDASRGAHGYDACYASSICSQCRAPRYSERNFGRANALAISVPESGYIALGSVSRSPQ
jgi:hypothetical protein